MLRSLTKIERCESYSVPSTNIRGYYQISKHCGFCRNMKGTPSSLPKLLEGNMSHMHTNFSKYRCRWSSVREDCTRVPNFRVDVCVSTDVLAIIGLHSDRCAPELRTKKPVFHGLYAIEVWNSRNYLQILYDVCQNIKCIPPVDPNCWRELWVKEAIYKIANIVRSCIEFELSRPKSIRIKFCPFLSYPEEKKDRLSLLRSERRRWSIIVQGISLTEHNLTFVTKTSLMNPSILCI